MRVPALRTVAGVFLLAPFFSGCTNSQATYDPYGAEIARMNQSAVEYVRRVEAEGKAKNERRLEALKPPLAEYVVCNRKASIVVASQPGDPRSLAIAARSLCGSVEANLRKVIYDAFSDDPGLGNETIENIRTRTLDDNTGDIVANRLKANSTPAPSGPSETPHTDRRI